MTIDLDELPVNEHNESREYVTFGTSSAHNQLKFRPNSTEKGWAGIYPETRAEEHETEAYYDEAESDSIEVIDYSH